MGAKLLGGAAAITDEPMKMVSVTTHTDEASAYGKELCVKFGEIVEAWSAEFPTENVSVQEIHNRYHGVCIAARSFLVGSIAMYANELKVPMEQIVGLHMHDYLAQCSVLMKGENEVAS